MASSRSTRAKATKASPAKNNRKLSSKRKAKQIDDSDALDSESDAGSDFQEAETKKRGAASDDSDEGFDSDALDDSEDELKKRKRKRIATPAKKSTRSSKKRKVNKGDDEELEDGHELEDDQEIVGTVVQAPTTGREPVYRLAEKEWKDFVESFTDLLAEVDNQVPPLPPKDVINRIYRDVRFSNDKTPYKKSLSPVSPKWEKGIFAAFEAGGRSVIAAGAWCPGRNELATIRSNILRNSSRLRNVISAPEFVKHFGEPEPHPDRIRRSVFGQEDELKVAPKGIDKTHKDIALLKCDHMVVEPGFKERLASVARVMQPFVHCMNDLITLAPDDDDSHQRMRMAMKIDVLP
ncbi:hypothetical protein BD779DRAFT_1572821 [Infundibulicybe gibba]|nr:hypothetical protein BD779DRAFT_1572821 [Infundibulicybe gibba]